MDLQARKLEFIEEYIRLADEKIVLKFEKLLRSEKNKAAKLSLKPLTQIELDTMIEESEIDIQHGNVLSHNSVKQSVNSWRSSKK
jgi:hypothetical protein